METETLSTFSGLSSHLLADLPCLLLFFSRVVFRLFRIFRLFRLIKIIKSLRVLFQILLETLPKLWTIILLMIITFYIYAIAGVRLFYDLYWDGVRKKTKKIVYLTQPSRN
jgi:hypothetical protein